MNVFEEMKISANHLPQNWSSEKAQLELEDFLQQNWEQRSVFFDDGKVDSKQQFLKFQSRSSIRTNNYVGTIVFNGEQLNIFPKVFRPEADDNDIDNLDQKHLFTNLVKWLEYCTRSSYPFIDISTEFDDIDDLKELFITLYLGYVIAALERGMFYRYVDETEDLSYIKGKFDIRDYYTLKIPSGRVDSYKCIYSKFEFDNKLNRIIKCTCKMLYGITSRKNQKNIQSILMRLNEVSDENCVPSDCDEIRLNDFQKDYKTILSLSKMFLLNKLSTMSLDMNDSFCFLFPTELLFEGFIGGFMKDVLSEFDGKTSLQKSDMQLIDTILIEDRTYGGAFTMRHDILVELDGKSFILDTKYKMISRFEGDNDEAVRVVRNEPSETDVTQVCEYARKRNVSDVFLLYPQFRYEDIDSVKPIGKSLGRGGNIDIHFVRMPFIFEHNTEKTYTMLRQVILDCFGLSD